MTCPECDSTDIDEDGYCMACGEFCLDDLDEEYDEDYYDNSEIEDDE